MRNMVGLWRRLPSITPDDPCGIHDPGGLR
jgi:hypothetical protein